MPIAHEVIYTTTGRKKKKTRNVIGVMCPSAITQAMGYSELRPIYVEMGDLKADWNETSAGYEFFMKNGGCHVNS